MSNKILIYKRTHTGDPNKEGVFGFTDCMGRVRSYEFDVIIGVGGIGNEPQNCGIAKKVTWIGINPIKKKSIIPMRGPILTFEKFKLFDQDGPLLETFGDSLPKRLFCKNGGRYLKNLNCKEKEEAYKIIQYAFDNN